MADNVHEDDIDDDMMIVTDIYDNNDMDNPYNADSGSHDIDDDLD